LARDRLALRGYVGLLASPFAGLLLGGQWRCLCRLDPARREEVIRKLRDSTLPGVRVGLQALKRIICSLAYTLPGPDGSNPYWPAMGYPGPPPPPRVTPEPLPVHSVSEDETIECDAVIVGSGAGGSVVAAALARTGRSVVILESGRQAAPADLGRREADALGALYWRKGHALTRGLDIPLLAGNCLGGGTLINYATSLPTPLEVREEWARQLGLGHYQSSAYGEDLAAVAGRLSVSLNESRPGVRDEILARGLSELGWHHATLPRNTRDCTQDEACGFCGLGCPGGAKQSTPVTYLRDAVEAGARIITEARARRILVRQGRAVGVDALCGRLRLRVNARAVIVAAGALESPALLLRSGLGGEHAGRHLALHPATAVMAEMSHPVRPWAGTTQAVYSARFARAREGVYGYLMETAPAHPALAAIVMPWSGADHFHGLMKRLERLALVGLLVRDHDSPGRITLSRKGEPVVHYPASATLGETLTDGLLRGARILEVAGAREIWSPQTAFLAYRPADGARDQWSVRIQEHGFDPGRVALLSFHQLGSCRMSASPRDGVVDPEHRVWGVPGLFVADGSVLPSPTGANPMLTIMAFAHRAGQIVAAEF
jgi:glycine/D-amino acid oxidase-like deaminating enzyme